MNYEVDNTKAVKVITIEAGDSEFDTYSEALNYMNKLIGNGWLLVNGVRHVPTFKALLYHPRQFDRPHVI